MTDNQVIDNLAKFGLEFQTKAVVTLLSNRSFLEQINDIIDPVFFDSDANKWIIKTILSYFRDYKTSPTVLVLKHEADKIIKDEVLKTAIIAELKNIFHTQKETPDDLQYVQDEFLAFAKNQAVKKAIFDSVNLLSLNRFDQIRSTFDKALTAGQPRDLGHFWNEEFESRAVEDARNTIPTGWSVIDDLSNGGMGEGELFLIVAGPGIGKSITMSSIGAHALRQGKTVVHYTMELSAKYTGQRYDTIFSGIQTRDIPVNKDLVYKHIKNIPGKLFIKYFPTRSINTLAMAAHIKRLIQLGHKPDFIIVDYADLMRSIDGASARYEELGYIYEELRGLAGEFSVPILTASQVSRQGFDDDIIEASKIAGAFSKIMICDFILSISRKVGDKLTKTARFHVMKNRFGKDGLTFPAMMDLDQGKIEIYDPDSLEGAKVKERLNSGEGIIKGILARKFLDKAKVPQEDIPSQ